MMAALDAGAEDIVDEGDTWRVTCAPTDLAAVVAAHTEAGITVESEDTTMLPQNTIALETVESAKSVLRVIDALDDLDDVQDVYANFDIPDEILQQIEVA
jgi:transcriptional/translational regulatory protein YebC/TACO1